MKSNGTPRDTIKVWNELSFSLSLLFLPYRSLLSSPRVCTSVVTDDTEAAASCSHCRWQWQKKKKKEKGQERRHRLQPAQAILTEKRLLVRTNRKGRKLWQWSNVPFTELHHPLFNFHVNWLVFKKCHALLLLERVHQRQPRARETKLFITFTVRLCSFGLREAVSNLATLTVLSPRAALSEWPMQNFIKYKKEQQRRLIPWCGVARAGCPSGGARQEYGQQLPQDILLAALCVAYHNRQLGRVPNNGRGWEDGRESREEGKGRNCIVMCFPQHHKTPQGLPQEGTSAKANSKKLIGWRNVITFKWPIIFSFCMYMCFFSDLILQILNPL